MQHLTSILASKWPHNATLHSLCPSCCPKGLTRQEWARSMKNWECQRVTNIHTNIHKQLYIYRWIDIALVDALRSNSAILDKGVYSTNNRLKLSFFWLKCILMPQPKIHCNPLLLILTITRCDPTCRKSSSWMHLLIFTLFFSVSPPPLSVLLCVEGDSINRHHCIM